MFILIGEAYRSIESDHNPLLREARKKAADTYETTAETINSKFKSRRPEGGNQQDENDFFKGYQGTGASEKSYDWDEEKFLRRYRVQHLRNDSNVPMSIRNVDRHGMNNLKHDPVKPLDRLKVPPFLIYFVFFGTILGLMYQAQNAKDLNFEELQRRNTLLAMKKTQEKIEYEENEVTPAEVVTMQTKQYKTVVEEKGKQEQRKLNTIRSVILQERKSEKIDIRQ
ncbi:UNKNOWN [Stylonychia lemnae]|uniref:Uncharacterized protein n=1 Tax=Stylonychia lemnae TaxID=5949 RepID=A0A078B8P3_STYLE|nr:UNKNOWN [Stylonychia lemnae]|eukprot:CDW90586.1 UNKNOWN [Stylonychia lemnae]